MHKLDAHKIRNYFFVYIFKYCSITVICMIANHCSYPWWLLLCFGTPQHNPSLPLHSSKIFLNTVMEVSLWTTSHTNWTNLKVPSKSIKVVTELKKMIKFCSKGPTVISRPSVQQGPWILKQNLMNKYTISIFNKPKEWHHV